MAQNNRNYQKELEGILERLEGSPSLLLHGCCAPCSSYVMEYLAPRFAITLLYYNPNIDDGAEYEKRLAEERRLIEAYNGEARAMAETGPASNPGSEAGSHPWQSVPHPITLLPGRYDPREFYEIARGYEQVPEGGERCFRCYELRLREAARLAAEQGFDYFTTTLTISPLKNAGKLNEIGERLAREYGVRWLPSDFKKKGGYQRSIVLSAQYDLYRQNYCGCSYSKAARSCEKCRNAGNEECKNADFT